MVFGHDVLMSHGIVTKLIYKLIISMMKWT